MRTRKIIIALVGVGIFAGSIAAASLFINQKKSSKESSVATSENVKQVVKVEEVKKQDVQTYVPLTGRIIAADKIDLYAEVSGVMQQSARPFKPGVRFAKGDILFKVDDQEARQNIISQKNSFLNTLVQIIPELKIDYPTIYEDWYRYSVGFDVHEKIPSLPETETERQKLYLISQNIFSQYHNIKRLETQLDKYVVRAPFYGTLTETTIQQGTLVRVGQKMGEFSKAYHYEMKAAVRPKDMRFVQIGDDVALFAADSSSRYSGKVIRINDKVDSDTQMIEVFIRVEGEGLRPGMYFSGKTKAAFYEEVIPINRESLVGNNQVFIIADSTASLQKVEVLDMQNDTVILKGLEDGIRVINEEKAPSFEGTAVTFKKKG